MDSAPRPQVTGVFAAVTVATAALTKGSAIADLAPAVDPDQTDFAIEHPAGQAEVLRHLSFLRVSPVQEALC